MRIQSTIRRPVRSWSPAVAILLQRLEAVGFDGAPRWLGIDDQGREILSYVEGIVPEYPLASDLWSHGTLVASAELLRGFHDATVGLDPSAPWRFRYPNRASYHVICHNDIAPYNTVYMNGHPVAFIDFDTAGPGPRIWDVCYAAYRFVPLIDEIDHEAHGVPSDLDVFERLRLFVSSYGAGLEGDLIQELIKRIEYLIQHIQTEAGRGVEWHVDNVREGHVELYERHIEWIQRHRSALTAAIR